MKGFDCLSLHFPGEQCSKPRLVGLYKGLYILPSYIGIIINQYKDPHQPTSIMEVIRVLNAAQVCHYWSSK